MARNEARLSVSIWTDDDFLALSPLAQRLFMFLLSQPDLAHDGVIALRERRWSKKAAGLTEDQIRRDLAELSTARFVVVDEDAEELLVRSFIRRDEVYRQPNILRSAQRHLGTVLSRKILIAVAAEIHRVAEADNVPKGSKDVIDELIAFLPIPSENPSPNPSRKGSTEAPGEGRVVTAVTTDAPFSLLPGALPDPDPPLPQASESQRGMRLPADFAVTDEMKAWARAKAPLAGIVDHEMFVDHWHAQSGQRAVKRDWEATWRNWMRRVQENRSGGNRPGPRSTTDERMTEAADLGRRMQAEIDARNGRRELGA